MSRPTDPPFDAEGSRTHPIRASDAPAPERMVLLVIGPDGVVPHALPAQGAVVVGRAEGCDVRIADPSISRRHARLELAATGVAVVDLASANGVRVRERRIAPDEPVGFAPGEVIELGSVMVVVQRGTAHLPRTRWADVAPARARATLPPRADRTAAPVPDASAVVRAPAMRKLYELVARVAPSAISVLVLGETGVGKELVAEALHRASPRARGPFVKLNCAALSESLLESELFGHEKGSFTGAQGTKPGLLEAADGGTVFLDEVGELPLATQAKLLRVLEERMVRRVGAVAPRAIDVRFVSATNRDLSAEVARGAFRQDFFFRLNGITLVVPPLRERRSEIAPLVERFAAGAARFGPDVLARLEAHAWPGNIRELRNVVQRAVVLAGDGEVTPAHLPPELTASASPSRAATLPAPAPSAALRGEVEAFERQRIVDALAKCSGNQTRAAELLGVSRRMLVNRLRDYAIPRPRKGPPSE